MIPHRFTTLVSLALVVVLSAPVLAAGPAPRPCPGTSSPVPDASAAPGVPTLPVSGAPFGTYHARPAAHR